MFATDQQFLVYYRIFPGNVHGMSALKIAIKEAGVKNVCVVGDKGFSPEANINMLDEANIDYIFPLKRSHRCINYERLQTRGYDQSFDGHFLYRHRPIFYYSYSVKDPDHAKKRNIIVFYDPRLRTEEEACYLRRVEDPNSDYTMQGFRNKQFAFGTISMMYHAKNYEADNISHAYAQEIYVKYKSRMEVETVFDMYKISFKRTDLICKQTLLLQVGCL